MMTTNAETRDLVDVMMTGACSLDDIRAHVATLARNASVGARRWLVEFRDITASWPARGVRELASDLVRGCSNGRPEKCALVANADLTYGMLRMYEIYSDVARFEVRVFRGRLEALAWLSGPNE